MVKGGLHLTVLCLVTLLICELLSPAHATYYNYKRYPYKKKQKNQERKLRIRRTPCEEGPECRDLVSYDFTNCVRRCMSPNCFAELYAHDELEEGEIDDVKNFLFKGWSSSSVSGMVGVCAFVFALAIIAEILTYLLLYLHKEATRQPLDTPPLEDSNERSPLLRPLMIPASLQDFHRRRLKFVLLLTFVHVLHLTTGYFLMLALMTYNGWIAIALVLGIAIGYYVFGVMKYSLRPIKQQSVIPPDNEEPINGEHRDNTSYENI